MLQQYLESEHVLPAIRDGLQVSTDGTFKSLVDGSVWQSRTASMTDRLVIPLNIFFDDFLTGDTSSPHARSTSICGIYISVPCLPRYLSGKLCNMLTAGFIKTQDRKDFRNDQTLKNIVEELIDLEINGLEIISYGETVRVCFVIGFIVGDNLGVNGVLDWVECFRANHFCRVCKRARIQTESDCKEYPNYFRSEENYEEDLLLDDVSRTGLKARTIFNNIPSFHAVNNFYFDVMHDVLEGVALYDLQHCLHYFVYVKKYLTVGDLNHRKNMFVYGNLNSANIADDFKESSIKNKQLKITASESMVLVTFLPLIIGPLIPDHDEVWLFFCSLVKILHIVLLDSISYELVNELRLLIEYHHKQYIHLFNDTLKPKFHNIIHYPTAILKGGPLRSHWGMRYESKHKESKQYSKINQNRKNLCSSLSIKAGMKFAFHLFKKSFITASTDLNVGTRNIAKLEHKYRSWIDFKACSVQGEYVTYLSSFEKNSATYSKGTIFYLRSGMILNIYQINEIFLNDQEELLLICSMYKAVDFNSHLQSFLIEKCSSYSVIRITEFEARPINIHTINNSFYFRICNYYNLNNILPNSVVN